MSNTTSFELTIYIAGKGSHLQQGGTSGAGHIWYGLSGQSQSFGFAPKIPQKETPLPVEGRRVENDTQNYLDVAFKTTYQITEAQYQKLLAFGEAPFLYGFSNTYWAPSNSCVDFVWAALDHAGISRDKGFEGALIPTQNRDKLLQFVDLPILEQVDWLDLAAMLTQLNPNLSPAQLEALIRAGSADSTGGEEGVLDAVRRLVLGPNINPTKVSAWTALLDMDAARVDFVNNNKALQAHRSFKLLEGQLSVSANEVSASEVKPDFAAFLSLHHLSPVVFRGGASANATLMATHTALAQQWSHFDEHFSAQWLQDRSAMHGYVLQVNERDLASRLLPAPGQTSTYDEDMRAAEYVQVGNAAVRGEAGNHPYWRTAA